MSLSAAAVLELSGVRHRCDEFTAVLHVIFVLRFWHCINMYVSMLLIDM